MRALVKRVATGLALSVAFGAVLPATAYADRVRKAGHGHPAKRPVAPISATGKITLSGIDDQFKTSVARALSNFQSAMHAAKNLSDRSAARAAFRGAITKATGTRDTELEYYASRQGVGGATSTTSTTSTTSAAPGASGVFGGAGSGISGQGDGRRINPNR